MSVYSPARVLPVAALTALAGAAIWLPLTWGSLPLTDFDRATELRIVALSAGAAGAVVAPLFGRHMVLAIVAALVATGLGAALAATILAAKELGVGDAAVGLVFGPAAVFGALVQSPKLIALWAIPMLLAQAEAERFRTGSCGCP